MRKKIYTRNVGVLLSEETYQALISITDQLEISVSEFIRELIEERIKRKTEGGKKYEYGSAKSTNCRGHG
jgi:predicted CopG family antitoxin